METRLKRQLVYGLLLLFILGMLNKANAQSSLNIL
jgi:hypothetical protein